MILYVKEELIWVVTAIGLDFGHLWLGLEKGSVLLCL